MTARRSPDIVLAIMAPPEGFIEDAVTQGLAIVEADEALMSFRDDAVAAQHLAGDVDNDVDAIDRCDSGIYDLGDLDDGPPTIRLPRYAGS